ncbi:hypothetical protein L6164_020229 [Bauhinia variegata]|uniref:Uncharacterized protein n=1 Tax=Bauhinia variegata TaxID=167791 RepID=A0ACB9MXT7_BAUVA|nr:hypothetical protein L6164_020229 [Bauhinia variegata]
MASKCTVRSISLPSRSHPSVLRVEEELNKLKNWEAESKSTSGSVFNGLSLLEELYICLDEFLNMGSTQQVISRRQGEEFVEELLDGSVRILDICGITRDTMLQIKENVQALHSSLRRRKGDSTIEKSKAEYAIFTRKMKKDSKKLIIDLKKMESKFGVSPLLSADPHLASVVRVLREVIAMNISVFQSLLSFLAVPVSKAKATKWLLVARLMHSGGIACEENVNELQSVDVALSTLLSEGIDAQKMQAAHQRLEALEIVIESLENSLERVFRRLIKTRSSLLNIISQ